MSIRPLLQEHCVPSCAGGPTCRFRPSTRSILASHRLRVIFELRLSEAKRAPGHSQRADDEDYIWDGENSTTTRILSDNLLLLSVSNRQYVIVALRAIKSPGTPDPGRVRDCGILGVVVVENPHLKISNHKQRKPKS